MQNMPTMFVVLALFVAGYGNVMGYWFYYYESVIGLIFMGLSL